MNIKAIVIFLTITVCILFNINYKPIISLIESMETSSALSDSVVFKKHVDGDTSKFIVSNEVISVRYLLIDTPETVKPNTAVQPFGIEASNFTKNKLEKAKKIELDYDSSGMKGDKYGRKLAYVYVDGQDLNELLVKKGLARVAYIYEPNTKNKLKYLKAEKYAKKKKLGIWSVKGYVSEKGYNY